MSGAGVSPAFERRVSALFSARYKTGAQKTDRMFAWLFVIQWAAGIGVALVASPLAWAGGHFALHAHLFAAIFLGGAISVFPLAMIIRYPGEQSTRYVIAAAQMMWSGLLIHLSGGRIETHFHIFGSLAFIAFYRDAKVLVPATVVTTADHFLRGFYWPESIYGVANPEWWRFLEHAGWVLYCDLFLLYNCVRARAELVSLCRTQLEAEDSQDAQARVERLAALGQLAASVGHELRNPLAAVRNAATFIDRRLHTGDAEVDPKVDRFLELIQRELDASSKIITDLLDFSRPKAPVLHPCPLRPLVDEAVGIVPKRAGVEVLNDVPADGPIPRLDKGQFRQVVMNIVQNAVEAFDEGSPGRVTIHAEGEPAGPLRLTIVDDGPGMSDEVLDRIMEPLYSTKTKGTGLGLAVVATIVERHGGALRIESAVGQGTRFEIELPVEPSVGEAAA